MAVGDIVTTALGMRGKIIAKLEGGKVFRVKVLEGHFKGREFSLLAVACTPELEI